MRLTNIAELSLHHRLYLHYLDRELATSVGFRPSEGLVHASTRCLLIATPAPLYCGLSPAWETSFYLGSIPAFLGELQRAGQLQLLSNHPTQDEFLAARVEAYKHDASRYPMYFNDDLTAVSQLTPNVPNPGSTTRALREGLLRWSAFPDEELRMRLPDDDVRQNLQLAVAETLKHRQEAVTLALFRERLGKLATYPRAVGVLSREISKQYTEHYRTSQAGDIPTGLKGLETYDCLTRMFPLYDLPILTTIARLLGAQTLVSNAWLEPFLACRGQQAHVLFADRLRVLLAGVCAEAGYGLPCPATASNREAFRQTAIRLISHSSLPELTQSSVDDMLFALTFRVNSVITRGNTLQNFAKGTAAMEQELNNPQVTKVLLAVAADVEHDAVVAAAKEAGMPQYQRHFVGDHTYFALGNLGGCELYLVKCTAGTGGVSGALPTLLDAVNDIQPHSIIMPGIAFGLKPDKQKLSQVLLSKQIMAYDLKRLTEDKEGNITITPRGDRVSASPRLHDRFWSGSRDWNVTKVHDGLILSGDTLVDSRSFKSELLRLEPEAIGGEMEAAGVYVASVKGHIDWIVVKAICDWGENKDKRFQKHAARNAVGLVFHVIKQGGLKR